MDRFRALLISRDDAGQKVGFVDMTPAELMAGDVTVRVSHSTINYKDGLAITGKGLKKLDDDAAVIVERGVLRQMLPIWLTAPGLAPLVAGWDSAAQGHGGDGAFYVRLRRERDYR